MSEEYQKRKKIFLKSDSHAVEIQLLYDAIGTACTKLAPALREETGRAFLQFMEMAGNDINNYLNYHMSKTEKEKYN